MVLQELPSQYPSLVECVPYAVAEKEALRSLRDIANPNNNFSFHQKCEKIRNVIGETFYNSETRLSYRSKIIILNVIDWIFRIPFDITNQTIISEINDSQCNIKYITNWIMQSREHAFLSRRPCEVLYFYAVVLFSKFTKLHTIRQSLKQRIEILRIQNRSSKPTYEPTFLNTKESLNICPDLKDKLTSSAETLLGTAANDICSICIEETISEQENFAILDKCVHLFCSLCISRWFEKA